MRKKTVIEDRHWVWDVLEFVFWIFAGILALCLAALPKAKR